MISFLFIKWTKLYYVCSLYEQYQDIRFYKLFTEEFYDIKTNSAAACIFENVKIVKLFCSVDQVVRKISQAFLGRDLWNNRSKTTKSFAFFQKESVTTYFSGCTGSFQSGSATADDYNITFLWYVNYITGPFINLIDNICDIIKLIYGCKKKIR